MKSPSLSDPCPPVAELEDSEDRVILRRFVERRDMLAFEALVNKHSGLVLGVCRRVLGNDPLAEDAFQETFLVLSRKAASLKSPHLLGNWLYGTAVRTAMKIKRQQHRGVASLDLSGFDDDSHENTTHGGASLSDSSGRDNPAEQAAREETRRAIDEEIDQLPKRYRDVVVLCYIQGRTNVEAARQLGCPEGSVSGYLSRARERLRAALSRRGVYVGAGLLGAALFREGGGQTASAKLIASTVDNVLANLPPGFLSTPSNSPHVKPSKQTTPSRGKPSTKTSYAPVLAVVCVLTWSAAAAQCAPEAVSPSKWLSSFKAMFSRSVVISPPPQSLSLSSQPQGVKTGLSNSSCTPTIAHMVKDDESNHESLRKDS